MVIRVRVIVQAVVLGEEIVEPVHGAHVLLVRLVVDVVVAVDDAVGATGDAASAKEARLGGTSEVSSSSWARVRARVPQGRSTRGRAFPEKDVSASAKTLIPSE